MFPVCTYAAVVRVSRNCSPSLRKCKSVGNFNKIFTISAVLPTMACTILHRSLFVIKLTVSKDFKDDVCSCFPACAAVTLRILNRY